MKIKHGLISGDSHAQVHRDAFTSRMSARKWGDRIPHLIETSDRSHMADAVDSAVHRWVINGQIIERRGVSNCPAAMGDESRNRHPQRWEDVPPAAYDPIARLSMLDADGVDAEVLFPNPPVQSASFLQWDAEFELDCVKAHNDAMAEWREASDRYIPLALIPYLSDVSVAIKEVERSVRKGHAGVLMLAEPMRVVQGKENLFGNVGKTTLSHAIPLINDRYWDPLWAACQDLNAHIHWHATGGIGMLPPRWDKYNRSQESVTTLPTGLSVLSQYLPSLLFSGRLDRFPRLKWICAETGMGWFPYVLDACDHEWERRRLWNEGLDRRPSEIFREQVYVSFWFEQSGVRLRDAIGVDRILWQSDFPHNTSTYPDSWKQVRRTMEGVSALEQKQMLYANALQLYGLTHE
jgi:predicted TIM-barrel fold metal-dependent hydrolase